MAKRVIVKINNTQSITYEKGSMTLIDESALDMTTIRKLSELLKDNGWRLAVGLEIDLYAHGHQQVPDLSKL